MLWLTSGICQSEQQKSVSAFRNASSQCSPSLSDRRTLTDRFDLAQPESGLHGVQHFPQLIRVRLINYTIYSLFRVLRSWCCAPPESQLWAACTAILNPHRWALQQELLLRISEAFCQSTWNIHPVPPSRRQNCFMIQLNLSYRWEIKEKCPTFF